MIKMVEALNLLKIGYKNIIQNVPNNGENYSEYEDTLLNMYDESGFDAYEKEDIE